MFLWEREDPKLRNFSKSFIIEIPTGIHYTPIYKCTIVVIQYFVFLIQFLWTILFADGEESMFIK